MVNHRFRSVAITLAVVVGCSPGALVGAPCGDSSNCPAGQRCAPPADASEPWGRCVAPALDVRATALPSGRTPTPGTGQVELATCKPLLPVTVPLDGDWVASSVCVDQVRTEATLLLAGGFKDCALDLVRGIGWTGGALGVKGSEAVKTAAASVDMQLRLSAKKDSCDVVGCATHRVDRDRMSLRCQATDAGNECLCSAWFTSNTPLSGTLGRDGPNYVLSTDAGVTEQYEAAPDGSNVRLRKMEQLESDAPLVKGPLIWTLTPSP